jgi:hypothetical protein
MEGLLPAWCNQALLNFRLYTCPAHREGTAEALPRRAIFMKQSQPLAMLGPDPMWDEAARDRLAVHAALHAGWRPLHVM